ncbi:MAG: hypothetical protein MJZ61_05885 [Bacteroidales bacterium]|nr:hypothetical protein [Bacteroidales bacterium]
MEYLKVFGIVLVIIALCFVGLGIQTFWGKKKRFPQYEVGENEEMQKLGIYCMNQVQQMIDKELIEGKKSNHSLEDCEGCPLRTANCAARKIKEQQAAKQSESPDCN